MEAFHDESLPAGKWTRRESKQNWRATYLEMRKKDEREQGSAYLGYRSSGGYSGARSGAASGYQTPREIKEEQWKQEAESTKPGKLEMREMYKELGGRKSKGKAKYTAGANSRDRGGWTPTGDD